MASYTDDQVISITKNNPNKKLIAFYQAKYKVMRANVTGIGAAELIEKLEGFERDNIMKARKKMMISNKDLLVRVMKPRNKIYTARGGIESYNLSTSEQIQEYKEFLSSCAGKRTSLKQFHKDTLQRAFDIDPMGLKWVGINSYGEPYPTYKCIMNIRDYEVCDGTPEYVEFKCTDKEIQSYIQSGIIPEADVKNAISDKVFRFVDDTSDRIVMWDSAEPRIVASTQNPFGVVPGEVVSNIPCEDEHGNKYYESALYDVSELLSLYILGRSIYNIAYSQAAYPIMWMQAAPCPTCQGKKVIAGNALNGGGPGASDMTCPECRGSGIYPHIQNSDTYIWEFSKDLEGAVPRPPLGVIEAATENLRYMKENNIEVEDLTNMTMWGVVKVNPNAKTPQDKSKPGNNTSETAFEANLNEDPKKDKQKEFSVWYGDSYKWYVDTMGKLRYGNDYISSAILMGDRYAPESPDEILTRITKAKEAGAAQAVLESLHFEYLDYKYENNPLEARKYKIYYIGEPYFFFTVADILAWPQIPQIQLLEKQMWGEFMCTLTDQIIASIPDGAIIETTQAMLRDFVTKKYIADKKADALLFASDGSMLTMGDNARVKAQLAKDPKHLGKTFNVVGVKEGVATLSAGDTTITYNTSDLERIS